MTGVMAMEMEMVKAANRWFEGLERRLEGRDWIACADFTIADILLATVLREIRKTDLLAAYPRLTAYCARALARPSWRHTLRLYAKRLGVEIADMNQVEAFCVAKKAKGRAARNDRGSRRPRSRPHCHAGRNSGP